MENKMALSAISRKVVTILTQNIALQNAKINTKDNSKINALQLALKENAKSALKKYKSTKCQANKANKKKH